MQEDVTPLSGGNINLVVRMGDTVRRNLTEASPTIHKLLLHLESKGFQGSPRFLGIDGQNREVLSYLEGETGIPSYIWLRQDTLVAAAQLLRQFHDATLDFKPTNAQWAYSYPDKSRHEVICHNDFAPYNFIFRNQRPYTIIDFDLSGPGPRLKDVAYAAYWLTPLSFNSSDQKALANEDLNQGSPRLRLFCKTYGISVNNELLNMITEVLAFMGSEEKMRQVIGSEATHKLKCEGHLAHWQREAKAFQNKLSYLKRNL